MRFFLQLFLFMITSCATKYILPGNRFMTPETQGGFLGGQIEIQKSTSSVLKIDDSENDPVNGVLYEDLDRMGVLISTSLFDSFDILVTHSGSGPTLYGGKFQIIGDPRSTNSEGHKMAAAFVIGGNEYEDKEDGIMDFELNGNELLLLYGYRLNNMFMPYTSFSQANYDFEGTVYQGNLTGDQPKFKSSIMSLNLGGEFSYEMFFIKVESTYQRIITSKTKDTDRLVYGLSVGLSW